MTIPEDPEIPIEDSDPIPEITEADPEGSSYNACIPIPSSLLESVAEGETFEGQITGTVITKDGKLQVEVETLNGETVEPVEPAAVEDAGYTGTEPEDVSLSSSEAFDKYSKGKKVTQ